MSSRPLQQEDDFYLSELLKRCGVVLCERWPHRLESGDQAAVVKKLHYHFQCDLAHPRQANQFRAELVKYLEESDGHFFGALQPLESDGDTSTSAAVRDSLVRLLLQVDDLQTELLSWLLEKMVLIAMTDEDSGDARSKSDENLGPTAQLILGQLRWLDRIRDGSRLANKVCEVLEAAPENLQRDLMASLPQILPEEHHSQVAVVLRRLMTDNCDVLLSAGLHSLSYLSVDSDVLDEVRSSVLKTISSTASEDLPVVVEFVLQSCKAGDEAEVVAELREKISFSTSRMLSQLTQRSKAKRAKRLNQQSGDKDVDSVILLLVEESVASKKAFGNAWMRAIDLVKSAAEHKPLDFLVLLILHAIPTRRKSVESLMKNKIRSGLFTENLIRNTFSSHADAIKASLENVLAIIDVLSQAVEPALAQHSLVLRREAFLHLDKYCRQEIFADLVYKISSSNSATRATVLKTLTHLARHHPEESAPYASFVESILDHVGGLELPNVRQIMDVLSFMAYYCSRSVPHNTSALQDNLHIIIGKQVSSKNPSLVRMGVIGAVVTVKNMSVLHENPDDTLRSVSTQLNTTGAGSYATLKKAKQLLERVGAKAKLNGEIGGLFMDELASVVQCNKMHKKLEGWIMKVMTEDFQEEFVVDLTDDGKSVAATSSRGSYPDEFLPTEVVYSLEDDAGIALNISQLVFRGLSGLQQGQKSDILRMLPHFRLLRMCIASLNDDLDEIFTLLVCPLVMPSTTTMQKVESLSTKERNAVCTSLFYAVNWMRELLNAFAAQEEEETRKKVLNRLKDLISLNSDLSRCLAHNTAFVPPPALHIATAVDWQPPSLQRSEKKPGGGRGKKRKAGLNDTVLTQTETPVAPVKITATQVDGPDASNAKQSALVDLDVYAPFLREVDLKVFRMLSYSIVTIGSEPSPEEERADPILRPKELHFLLKDLLAKLSHALVSSKSKKISPMVLGNSKVNLKQLSFLHLDEMEAQELAKFVVSNLDYMFGHLEELVKYIKRILELGGGDILGDTLVSPYVNACQEKIFSCVNALLAWNGFQSEDQRQLLKDALCVAARRKNTALVSVASLSAAEVAVGAFMYFADFSCLILDVTCAGAHLKLLETVFTFTVDDEDCKRKLSQVAEDYLRMDWKDSANGASLRGARFNAHVEAMLKAMLQYSSDIGERMESYVNDELSPILSNQATSSAAFPTLNKHTLTLQFRVLLETLANHVRSSAKSFDDWDGAVHVLHSLVSALRFHQTKPFVLPVVKYSRMFLEAFLKNCMPLLDRLFKNERAECIRLLKDIQQSTRLMQHVCSYSKIHKDTVLARQVPALKRSLEAFVYRVKTMLALNDAVDAFWFGVLKNRNLTGEEIDQSSTIDSETTAEGDEEDEENLPDEDEESDVDMDVEDNCGVASSTVSHSEILDE